MNLIKVTKSVTAVRFDILINFIVLTNKTTKANSKFKQRKYRIDVGTNGMYRTNNTGKNSNQNKYISNHSFKFDLFYDLAHYMNSTSPVQLYPPKHNYK